MNNKGFMFVETIVTTTILLVALVTIYVSYSAFIIGEKRRLYYDDMSYVYKTFTLKDVMYDETVFYTTGSYYNANALKKYTERINKHFYIISPGQTMFKSPLDEFTAAGVTVKSDKFENLMNDFNVKKLIYIPKMSNITDSDIIELQHSTNNLYLRNYLKKLDIPCETDSSCSSLYNGIIISIIREHKNGANIEDDYNNFAQCMKDPNKKTMECQEANYISWVYA